MHFNSDAARDIIMNHYLKPTNKAPMHTETKTTYSTACADKLQFELVLNNNVITDAKFLGEGCAIFIASSDLFLNLIKNKNLLEAKTLAKNYIAFVEQEPLSEQQIQELGELWVFYNVKKHYNRVTCATLIAKEIVNYEP